MWLWCDTEMSIIELGSESRGSLCTVMCDDDGANRGGRQENKVVLVFDSGGTKDDSPVAATDFKEGEEACGDRL